MASHDSSGRFRSARLIYRAVEAEDDDFIHAMSCDPNTSANTSPFIFRPQSKKDSENYRVYITEKSLIGVLICLPPSPTNNGQAFKHTPIGSIQLSAMDPKQVHHRHSEIGLTIISEYQGQGYGTEAIEWIVDWGFRAAGLHRIGIGCFSYNDGARRLYERLGFVQEGRKREFLWHNGGWHDIIDFAMLENEWRDKEAMRLGEGEMKEPPNK